MKRRTFVNLSAIAGSGSCLGTGLGLGMTVPRRAAAQPTAPQPMRDVVVLVPGITGSALRKDGQDLWALSGASFFSGLKTLGRNLDALRMAGEDESLDDLGDGVTPHRLIQDLHLVPGLWKIDGYTAIARSLATHYRLEPGQNYFEFAYDWRRSNVVSARRLARQAHDWLRAWRARSGQRDARLVFLAHSMGGLVVRQFVECMEGWKDTRLLVSFGTPYRGSLNAVGFLANGLQARVGSVELLDLTRLVRSFPSVYQLLPIYPCIETGTGLVRAGEVQGLPNIDAARAASGLRFHRRIEACVEDNRKDTRYLESGYRIRPVVGTYQTTVQSAVVRGGGVELLHTLRGQAIDGDGTVPRPSAKIGRAHV
jgi:hypothetical protein